MKKNIFILLCSLGLMSPIFANPSLQHPQTEADIHSSNQTLFSDGCEIKIINDCFDDIKVYGRFEDGTYLSPFIMKHWGASQSVSLYYYGSCHPGMDFYIETVSGKYKYNGFTPVGKIIRISGF